MTPSFWANKSLLVTGHTGFKGGWLSLWLTELGANVHGYSLTPSKPSFFEETDLEPRLSSSTIGDILDVEKLANVFQDAKPEIVIHMAAQSLVKESYSDPLGTYATNVLGTLNVLEASRHTNTVKSIVNVTTDKCYENREWPWPYRENDPLGGYDPYSSSKACSEIAASAYRSSFLANENIHLACVRAGNVIGGGDWADYRLIPDFFRALAASDPLVIRNPDAIRPWQHVLEPLAGYLTVAERLFTDGAKYATAFNFGPERSETCSVGDVADLLCEKTSGPRWVQDKTLQPHEAQILRLDSSKARSDLNWQPKWSLETALDMTVEWYMGWLQKQSTLEISLSQIREYQNS